MNAITPENEIPPAQSTAASGTLPIEQTNESTATRGPTSTFSGIRIQAGASVTKSALKEPSGDLLPEHLPVAAEVVRDVRPRVDRGQPFAPRHLLAAGGVVLVPRLR